MTTDEMLKVQDIHDELMAEIDRLRKLNADMLAALTDLVERLALAERNDDLPLPFAGYGYEAITKARAAIAEAKPRADMMSAKV